MLITITSINHRSIIQLSHHRRLLLSIPRSLPSSSSTGWVGRFTRTRPLFTSSNNPRFQTHQARRIYSSPTVNNAARTVIDHGRRVGGSKDVDRAQASSKKNSATPFILIRFSKSITPSILIISVGLLFGYHHLSSSTSTSSIGSLVVDRYHPFRITKSRLVDSDTAVLELDVPLLPSGQLESLDHPFYIESVYLKHPALQIERAYTPLSPITPLSLLSHEPTDRHDPPHHPPPLELLIKRYPDGEVSTHVHDLKIPGNQLELRGPVPTWKHPNNQIDEIVFIAAGTGITPALQLLRRIFNQPLRSVVQPLPKFQLIYLSRSLRSAYCLDEIQDYISNHPTLVSLKLVVDERNKDDRSTTVHVDKVGRLDLSDLQRWVAVNPNPGNQGKKRIIIVCGSDSLICAVAGCKGREYGSQGEIGGMLKALGYSSHQVVKL